MKQCPRSWWIRYVGSWNGWLDDSPPNRQKAYRLNKLESLATWSGKLVHNGIARLLRSSDETVEAVMEAMTPEVGQKFRVSSLIPAGKFGPKGAFQLEQHYFGAQVPATCVDDLLCDVRRCLEAFDAFCRDNPDLDFRCIAIEAAAASRFLHIDHEAIPIADREMRHARIADKAVSVWAAPDFVAELPNGRLFFVDWKTGSRWGESEEQVSGQLKMYAAWMRLRHEAVFDRAAALELYEFHLPSQEFRGDAISRSEVEGIIAGMDDEARQLLALRGDNDRVPAERCPPQPERSKCGQCRYREICPDGQTVLRS